MSTDVKINWHGVTPLPSAAETPSKPAVVVNKIKSLIGYGKPKEGEEVTKTEASPTEATKKSYRQAPEKIPPVFDGSQLLVFGIFESGEKPTGATIVADSPDGPLSIDIEVC